MTQTCRSVVAVAAASATQKAQTQVYFLELGAPAACCHKRKCQEVCHCARRSLEVFLLAHNHGNGSPAELLRSGERLCAAAQTAHRALLQCSTTRRNPWHRCVRLLRRRALYRQLCVAQSALNGAVAPELLLPLPSLGPEQGAQAALGFELSGVVPSVPKADGGSEEGPRDALHIARTSNGRAAMANPHSCCPQGTTCRQGAMGGDQVLPSYRASHTCVTTSVIRPSRKQDGPVSGLWVLPWQRPTTVPGARDHQAPLVMAAVGPSSGQDNASAALLLFTAGSGGFACEVPCSSPAERVTAVAANPAARVVHLGHQDGTITTCRYGMGPWEGPTRADTSATAAAADSDYCSGPTSFACGRGAITVLHLESTERLWAGDAGGCVTAVGLHLFAVLHCQTLGGRPDGRSCGTAAPGCMCFGTAANGEPACLGPSSGGTPSKVTAITSHQGLVFAANDRGELFTSTPCLQGCPKDRPSMFCSASSSDWAGRYGWLTCLTVAAAAAPAPEHVHTGSCAGRPLPGGLPCQPGERKRCGREGAEPMPAADGALRTSMESSACGQGLGLPRETGAIGAWRAEHGGLGDQRPGQGHGQGQGQASGTWRLLAGTSRGFVLLWAPAASQPRSGQLQLAGVIAVAGAGNAVPRSFTSNATHAIRGLYLCPEEGMLVGARADGQLAVLPLPLCLTPQTLERTGTSQAACPADAQPAPPGGDAAGGGRGAPVWSPPVALVRAHKGALTAAAATDAGCAAGWVVVTGSAAGGVKAWSAGVLRAAAEQQGVQLPAAEPRASSSTCVGYTAQPVDFSGVTAPRTVCPPTEHQLHQHCVYTIAAHAAVGPSLIQAHLGSTPAGASVSAGMVDKVWSQAAGCQSASCATEITAAGHEAPDGAAGGQGRRSPYEQAQPRGTHEQWFGSLDLCDSDGATAEVHVRAVRRPFSTDKGQTAAPGDPEKPPWLQPVALSAQHHDLSLPTMNTPDSPSSLSAMPASTLQPPPLPAIRPVRTRPSGPPPAGYHGRSGSWDAAGSPGSSRTSPAASQAGALDPQAPVSAAALASDVYGVPVESEEASSPFAFLAARMALGFAEDGFALDTILEAEEGAVGLAAAKSQSPRADGMDWGGPGSGPGQQAEDGAQQAEEGAHQKGPGEGGTAHRGRGSSGILGWFGSAARPAAPSRLRSGSSGQRSSATAAAGQSAAAAALAASNVGELQQFGLDADANAPDDSPFRQATRAAAMAAGTQPSLPSSGAAVGAVDRQLSAGIPGGASGLAYLAQAPHSFTPSASLGRAPTRQHRRPSSRLGAQAPMASGFLAGGSSFLSSSGGTAGAGAARFSLDGQGNGRAHDRDRDDMYRMPGGTSPGSGSGQLASNTSVAQPLSVIIPQLSSAMVLGSLPSGAYTAAARAIAAATGQSPVTPMPLFSPAGLSHSGGGMFADTALGHSPFATPRAVSPHTVHAVAGSPFSRLNTMVESAYAAYAPGRTSQGQLASAMANAVPSVAVSMGARSASMPVLDGSLLPARGGGGPVGSAYGSPYGSAVPGSPAAELHSPWSDIMSGSTRTPRNTFIRRSDLKLLEEIGSGAEGTVWRARWRHTDVAVKEMRPQAATLARIKQSLMDQPQRISAPGGGYPTAAILHRQQQLGLARCSTLPTMALQGGLGLGLDMLTRSQHLGQSHFGHLLAGLHGHASVYDFPRATYSSLPPTPTIGRAMGTTGGGEDSLGGDVGGGAGCGVDPELAAILTEVRALVALSQHPNIVRFIGLCVEPPLIVTEYYPRGSLFELLRKASCGDPASQRALAWRQRLALMHDVAAGMSYLHAQNYLHGDLRSPNVFMVAQDAGRLGAKIGDFGYAKLLGDGGRGSASMSNSANPCWVAPEALQVGRVTRSADVFSFAIVMWEVLTWGIPYEEYNAFQVCLRKAHERDFRPTLPPRGSLPHVPPHADVEAYVALMRHCWEFEPTARPTFDEVAERLDAMRAACTACEDGGVLLAQAPEGAAWGARGSLGGALPQRQASTSMRLRVSCAGGSSPAATQQAASPRGSGPVLQSRRVASSSGLPQELGSMAAPPPPPERAPSSTKLLIRSPSGNATSTSLLRSPNGNATSTVPTSRLGPGAISRAHSQRAYRGSCRTSPAGGLSLLSTVLSQQNSVAGSQGTDLSLLGSGGGGAGAGSPGRSHSPRGDTGTGSAGPSAFVFPDTLGAAGRLSQRRLQLPAPESPFARANEAFAASSTSAHPEEAVQGPTVGQAAGEGFLAKATPAAVSEVSEADAAPRPPCTAPCGRGGGSGGVGDGNMGAFASAEPATEACAGGGLHSPFANLALLLGLE